MGTTLKDIADHLNLSVSTVSRGLNGKGRMSKEVREKIRDTAEKLNYQPNEIARELKMQRSFTIGVIIPDVSNEFYSRLLKSIDQESGISDTALSSVIRMKRQNGNSIILNF